MQKETFDLNLESEVLVKMLKLELEYLHQIEFTKKFLRLAYLAGKNGVELI